LFTILHIPTRIWRAMLCLVRFHETKFTRTIESFAPATPILVAEFDSSLSGAGLVWSGVLQCTFTQEGGDYPYAGAGCVRGRPQRPGQLRSRVSGDESDVRLRHWFGTASLQQPGRRAPPGQGGPQAHDTSYQEIGVDGSRDSKAIGAGHLGMEWFKVEPGPRFSSESKPQLKMERVGKLVYMPICVKRHQPVQ
jgi:hypothetical protein